MKSEINDPFKKDEFFTKSARNNQQTYVDVGLVHIYFHFAAPTQPERSRAFPKQALQAQLNDPQFRLHLVTLCFSPKGRKIDLTVMLQDQNSIH